MTRTTDPNPIDKRILETAFHNTAARRPYEDETSYAERRQTVLLQQILIKLERAKLKRFKGEHRARLALIRTLLAVTILWMLVILIIVIASGMKKLTLSDSVLITLITTTTAYAVGFFYVVVKYLFNEKHST